MQCHLWSWCGPFRRPDQGREEAGIDRPKIQLSNLHDSLNSRSVRWNFCLLEDDVITSHLISGLVAKWEKPTSLIISQTAIFKFGEVNFVRQNTKWAAPGSLNIALTKLNEITLFLRLQLAPDPWSWIPGHSFALAAVCHACLSVGSSPGSRRR